MSLPKLFERIFWHNNTTPAVNETNLNAMSKGISDVDDRLISLGGLIMETVPEIQQDMDILGPAVESIDANVAAAQALAETAEEQALKSEGFAVGEQEGVPVGSDSEYFENNAEYFANIANPPIRVIKDFAPIISITDAINKKARDVKIKVESVQDLHGYTKPWVGGVGKNLADCSTLSVNVAAASTVGMKIGSITLTSTKSLKLSFEQSVAIGSVERNTLLLRVPGTTQEIYPTNITSPTLNKGYHEGIIENVSAGTYDLRLWVQNPNINVTVNNFMVRDSSDTDNTYAPYENICPITGHSEAMITRAEHNLFRIDSHTNVGSDGQGLTWTDNGNDTFSVSGTPTGFKAFLVVMNEKLPIGTYIMSMGYRDMTNIRLNDFYLQKNGALVRSLGTDTSNDITFTITAEDDYDSIVIGSKRASNGTACSGTIKPMIQLASDTNTAYEPYNSSIYVIVFGETYYGGTLDVTTGVLTLTHGYSDMGDLSWTKYSNRDNMFYATVSGIKTVSSVSTVSADIISSSYVYAATTLANLPDGAMRLDSNNAPELAVKDTRYNDATAFTTAVDGVDLVYELATPLTITLTPIEVELLFGYNTLFANMGDLSLTYDASGIIHIEEAKLDTETLKTIAAASSDFADFKSRVAAL